MDNEILDQDNTTIPTSLQRVPKDSSILTTGIIALPFSLGIIGIILSIVTLVNASNSQRIYNANPDRFLESSVKKVRAGKICAIVSLSLFGAVILIGFGFAALS